MGNKSRAPGWWYPWIFVGMFAVVIAANGALIWFARSSFSGLSTEGAYDKGIGYNRALEGAAAQARLGWLADVVFVPGQSGKGAIEVRLVDRDGGPLDGLEAEVLIHRPTQTGLDQRLALAPQGAGRFRAEVTLPEPGQWIVRVHAYRGSDVFQQETRVIVP